MSEKLAEPSLSGVMDIMSRGALQPPADQARPTGRQPLPGGGASIRVEPEHGLEAVAMSVMSEKLSRD